MVSIAIPKSVQLLITPGYIKIVGSFGVVVKKLGSLRVAIYDSRFYVLNEASEYRTEHCLSLFRNYFLGVSKGYRRKLRLSGVGFRAAVAGDKLSLKLGFSHEVLYHIPEDVAVSCSKAKGTIILIRGTELQRVNQVASEIRNLRKPDLYKGKGVHYDREVIILKKGKREGA